MNKTGGLLMASNRKFQWRCALGVAALLSLHALPASAQWTGRGEAGVVIASGNTETKAGNAKLAVAHKADAWTNQGTFAAVYAADEIGSTAQRWEATAQSSYQFNAHNFSFGGVRYENDHFSGFTHQGTVSGGVGHLFIDTPETRLTAQLGVGYKFSETREVFSPAGLLLVPRTSDNALATIGNVDYRHSFNASTTLLDKFTTEYTSENTFVQNELALQVKMNDKLALAVGYAVRYNTDPPAGFEKTDSLTTANIVYEVK
jgi:putative salt-induced outer membrane protein